MCFLLFYSCKFFVSATLLLALWINPCSGLNCWEADKTKFGCLNYRMCGFECSRSNNWCAFQGAECNCGDMCDICATLIENAELDLETSRCVRKGEPTSVTPSFRLSAECLNMCHGGPRPAGHGCPYNDCCSWGEASGIKCEHDQVVELDFREDLARAKKSPVLYGSFPKNLHKLSKLKKIRFIGGDLSGTLSASLGSLGQLEKLQISRSGGITGTIPSTFGKLHQLQSLDLSSNLLEGKIPPQVLALENLREIWLQNNDLSGPAVSPDYHLRNNLTTLMLFKNRLTGKFSSILRTATANHSQLRMLVISRNCISGTVPPLIGSLRNLNILTMSDNCLTGALPASIKSLSSLFQLTIDSNKLKGKLPLAPAMRQLLWFNVAANQFTGALPHDLRPFEDLRTLIASGNCITGTLPRSVTSLQNLTRIELNDNKLWGTLPPAIGSLANLFVFKAWSNKLSGSLPPSIGSMGALKSLMLDVNQLTSTFPHSIGSLKALTHFIIHRNNLRGKLPKSFGNLTTLRRLFLGSNPELKGSLPSSMQYMSELRSLSATSNDFTGRLPRWLNRLDKLEVLDLQGNEFLGLDCDLFDKDTVLANLSVCDLSNNNIAAGLCRNPSCHRNAKKFTNCGLCATVYCSAPTVKDIPQMLEGSCPKTKANEICEFHCAPGFRPKSGDNFMTCLEDGRWSKLEKERAACQYCDSCCVQPTMKELPFAKKGTCHATDRMNHEYVNETMASGKCVYECMDRFVPHPEHRTIKCVMGTWEIGEASCKGRCSALQESDIANIEFNSCDGTEENTECTYTCSDGFVPTEATTVWCGMIGDNKLGWEIGGAKCTKGPPCKLVPAQCRGCKDPKGVLEACSSVPADETCSYTCAVLYTPVDDAPVHLTCQTVTHNHSSFYWHSDRSLCEIPLWYKIMVSIAILVTVGLLITTAISLAKVYLATQRRKGFVLIRDTDSWTLQLTWLTTAPEWEALEWSSNASISSSSGTRLREEPASGAKSTSSRGGNMFASARTPLDSKMGRQIERLFMAGGPRGWKNKSFKLERVVSVRNPRLLDSFHASLRTMESRMQDQPRLFHAAFPDDGVKGKLIARLSRNCLPGVGLEHCPLMLAWHGCSNEAAQSICTHGAADIRIQDGGFFGTGVYLTPHAKYACEYAHRMGTNEDGEFTVVLCLIALGNTYPITRKTDYPHPDIYDMDSVSVFHYLHPIPFDTQEQRFCRENATRIDKGLKAGFDSHYVAVSAPHFQASDNDNYDYAEIVVKEVSQILPLAIVYCSKVRAARGKTMGPQQIALANNPSTRALRNRSPLMHALLP